MSVFGIVMTVVVAALIVAVIVRIVLTIVKPNHKSISEQLRGNDEKYE